MESAASSILGAISIRYLFEMGDQAIGAASSRWPVSTISRSVVKLCHLVWSHSDDFNNVRIKQLDSEPLHFFDRSASLKIGLTSMKIRNTLFRIAKRGRGILEKMYELYSPLLHNASVRVYVDFTLLYFQNRGECSKIDLQYRAQARLRQCYSE
jgi:hypothetical protein